MAKKDKGVKKYDLSIKPRHREVLKNYIENGKRSMGAAIRKAGYSEVTADQPTSITNTQSFQMLLREQLPDSMLLDRHVELLAKREYDWVEEPDPLDPKKKKIVMKDVGPNVAAVSKGLELAYKLKGSFAPEVAPPAMNIYNLFYKPEVRENMRQFEEQLKKNIIHEADTNKNDPGNTRTEGEGQKTDTA